MEVFIPPSILNDSFAESSVLELKLFSLSAFNILSLFFVLIVLIIICCGEVLFWLCLFGVLELHVPEWASLS
jgi:hypothetical protein